MASTLSRLPIDKPSEGTERSRKGSQKSEVRQAVKRLVETIERLRKGCERSDGSEKSVTGSKTTREQSEMSRKGGERPIHGQ